MKASFPKYTAISLIILILLGSCVVLVKPVYTKLVGGLHEAAAYLLHQAAERFGIVVSYSSLSPSVFSSIDVEDIEIRNKESGQKLITLNRATVRYDMLSVLRGRYTECVKHIAFSGGEVAFSKDKDAPLVEKIKAIVEKNKSAESESNGENGGQSAQTEQKSQTGKSARSVSVPFSLSFENIVLVYTDDALHAELFVKKATFTPAKEAAAGNGNNNAHGANGTEKSGGEQNRASDNATNNKAGNNNEVRRADESKLAAFVSSVTRNVKNTVQKLALYPPFTWFKKGSGTNAASNQGGNGSALSQNGIARENSKREASFEITSTLKIVPRAKSVVSLAKRARLKNAELSCAIGAKGNASADFGEVSAHVDVSQIKIDAYSLAKVSFIASYANDALSLRMVQNLLPFNIRADWTKARADLDVRLDAENLNLFDLLPVQAQTMSLRRLNGSTVSGVYRFTYNTARKTFAYALNGALNLTENAVKGGVASVYELSGTNEAVFVQTFTVDSTVFTGALNGTAIFKTLQLDGALNAKSVLLPNGKRLTFDALFSPIDNGSLVRVPSVMIGSQPFKDIRLAVRHENGAFLFEGSLTDGKKARGTVSINGIFTPKGVATPTLNSVTNGTALNGGANGSTDGAESAASGNGDAVSAIGGIQMPKGVSLNGGGESSAKNALDVHVRVDSFSLDSAARAALFFVKPKAQSSITKMIPTLSRYAFDGELFVSSDFDSYSLNAPYVSLYATDGKNEKLTFALSGGENLFSVTDMVLQYAGQNVTGDIQIDVGKNFSDVIFSSTLNLNHVPYNFAGTYVPGGFVSVLGEYGFEAYVDLNGTERLGTVRFSELPLQLSKMLLSASLDATFTVESSQNWNVLVPLFEIREISGVIAAKPTFAFSLSATNAGITVDSISYTDSVGSLTGTGAVSWLYTAGVLDALSGTVELSNPFSGEIVSIEASASNPDKKPMRDAKAANDYYFTLEGAISNLSFARFLKRQNPADTLNATLSASGTLSQPLVSLNVPEAMCSIKGYPLEASGSLLYSDEKLQSESIVATYRDQKLTNVVLDFSPKTFTGILTFDLLAELFPKTQAAHSLRIPFAVSCKGEDEERETNANSTPKGTGGTEWSENEAMNNNARRGGGTGGATFEAKQSPLAVTGTKTALPSETKKGETFERANLRLIPEKCTLEVSIAGISGDLINVKDVYTYRVRKNGARFDVTGGVKNEVAGFYDLASGDVSLRLASPSPVLGTIGGNINKKENSISLAARDIIADLTRMKGILTYPVFAIEEGTFVGNGTITGFLSDSEFNGEFVMQNLTASSPKYLTETIHVAKMPIHVEQSVFTVRPLTLTVKNGRVGFDAVAYFDRWRFDTLSMNIRTLDGTLIGAQFALPFMDATGEAGGDLSIDLTLDDVNITGDLIVERGSAELFSVSADDNKELKKSRMEAKADLRIEVGQKTEVVYPSRDNPILWAQIVPHTKMTVKTDTALDRFEFKGDFALRGGEVLYIGRNFYLREGRLVFNATQDVVDPRVTLRAEIRERDDDGNLIKIELSAENQLLSQLSPKLSSTPSLSEQELMKLLGKALFADSVSSDTPLQELAIGLVDYGAQIGVFRRVERQLRSVLKFDIFSFRTMFLQKAMLQAFNLNKDREISLGNFLDNSTVYVGKYFGDEIYADAMIELVYDESRYEEGKLFSGLRVQPEIGFEMNSPFANIRWSIAPDITTFNNLWVPYNKLTLSWKFQL